MRRQAFVDAAREAFFTHGYGATSMSAISAKVGGSKTTLWTYFPSKQQLFAAVVDDLVERYGRALEVVLDPCADIASELRRFARALLETLHSQPIIDLHRLTIGEAGRSPELGRMMFDRGQAKGSARLQAFIEAAMKEGKLRQGDPALAARQFASFLQAGSPHERMLGLIDAPDDGRIETEIETVVSAFMHSWAQRETH